LLAAAICPLCKAPWLRGVGAMRFTDGWRMIGTVIMTDAELRSGASASHRGRRWRR
jgi:hypothetical protein